MVAYSVSRRVEELALCVALGASKMQMMTSALERSMLLLGVGSAASLLGGILARRLLKQIVYQATPLDSVVLGIAVPTTAVLGFAAFAIPIRRALTIDPAQRMREE